MVHAANEPGSIKGACSSPSCALIVLTQLIALFVPLISTLLSRILVGPSNPIPPHLPPPLPPFAHHHHAFAMIFSSASSRAQRVSARNMASIIVPPGRAAPADAVASSSNLLSEPDQHAMQIDSSDAELSRSNSLVPMAEDIESASSNIRNTPRRDKGKGKESAVGIRVKEEPGATSGVVVIETVGNGASVSAQRMLSWQTASCV